MDHPTPGLVTQGSYNLKARWSGGGAGMEYPYFDWTLLKSQKPILYRRRQQSQRRNLRLQTQHQMRHDFERRTRLGFMRAHLHKHACNEAASDIRKS